MMAISESGVRGASGGGDAYRNAVKAAALAVYSAAVSVQPAILILATKVRCVFV